MDPWLVVVDMQEVFADPGSAWHSPGATGLVGRIGELASGFGPRVVRTRFVAPETPSDAWVDYYRAWPFALQPPDAPLYRLLDGLPEGPVVDRPTFSKWGDELVEVVGSADLVLCGVATDCCVLATALGATDAGRRVRVVGDACAGSSADAHRAALAVMGGIGPQLRVGTLAEACADLRG